MNKRARSGLIVLLLLVAQSCAAGAGNRETLAITGIIRIVGNEPFTRVVLTVSDGKEKDAAASDYLITGPLAEELRRHHQGERVQLDGSACSSPSAQFAQCFRPTRVTILNSRK